MTKNRKPLQPNPLSRFEPRIGDLRVYYASLSEYAQKARRGGAVVVTLRGKPVATLSAVPKGADWESLAVAANPKFQEIMERSRRVHREEGGLSPADMRRHFGVRAKPRPPQRARSGR